MSSRNFIAAAFCFTACHSLAGGAEPSLESVLEPIRVKYHLPALAGAIFTVDGAVEMAATGVRKAGTAVPVTTEDLWHLGSDTKAMTAALAGSFVAENKLSWDAKVVSFFPEIADVAPETMKKVTLGQVLSHQAGLVENLDWPALSKNGSLSEQRLAAVRLALALPAYLPGTYHYSNTDYVLVGAILEKIGGKPWEELIRERIFQPLGMNSAGFGGVGTPGRIDQPWPHLDSGVPTPLNGPTTDNPEVMGPAGTVHCSIKDWTRFLIDQLRGGAGMKALLPNAIYQAMQTNVAGKNEYGYGWIVTNRSWAGGKAITHAGTNTMNFCNCWMSAAKRFGVLVCLNQGGGQTFNASDEAVSAMIQRYLAKPKTGQ
jgi:CubicO group peptidase (beta-lactamase class C family)